MTTVNYFISWFVDFFLSYLWRWVKPCAPSVAFGDVGGHALSRDGFGLASERLVIRVGGHVVVRVDWLAVHVVHGLLFHTFPVRGLAAAAASAGAVIDGAATSRRRSLVLYRTTFVRRHFGLLKSLLVRVALEWRNVCRCVGLGPIGLPETDLDLTGEAYWSKLAEQQSEVHRTKRSSPNEERPQLAPPQLAVLPAAAVLPSASKLEKTGLLCVSE